MKTEREEQQTTIKESVDQPVKNPIITPGIRNVLFILIVLIIVGAGGYIIYRELSKNNQNQTPNTADQIRESFSPPSSTSQGFTPPVPGSQFSGGTNSAVPPATAPSSPSVSLPAQNQPATPAVPAAPVVYQNNDLGFTLVLPGNWAVDDRQIPGHAIFIDRNNGQIVGYVETYDKPANDNLNTLAQILQNSPSVSRTSQTSVSGQPAIVYSATAGYTGGIATIFNDRVYYFHGNLTDPNILSNFKFLN